MARHSSATAREETPDVLGISRTNTIMNALKRRALAILNDESLDAQSRAIIRYGLETNDPWLADLVRRADACERIVDTVDFSHTPESNDDDSSKEKLETLAEIICSGGDQSAAALLVLMRKFENSMDPKVVANTVKHFAFTRCGELNVHGMVDAQIAVLAGELLAGNPSLC